MAACNNEYLRCNDDEIITVASTFSPQLLRYTSPSTLLLDHDIYKNKLADPKTLKLPILVNPRRKYATTLNYITVGELKKRYPLHNRVTIDGLLASINATMVGKYFLCRNIAEPLVMGSLDTVVEDPEGDKALRLALYNFSQDPAILPKTTIIIIKSPFLKTTLDGGISLKCEDPTELCFLYQKDLSSAFPILKWRGGAIFQPEEVSSEDDSEDDSSFDDSNYDDSDETDEEEKLARVMERLSIRKSKGGSCKPKKQKDHHQIALKFIAEKKSAEALVALNRGLQNKPNDPILLEMRTQVCLCLQMYSKALTDIEALQKFKRNPVKLVYDKMEALGGMRDYKALLLFLKDELDKKNLEVPELRKLSEIMYKIMRQIRGDYEMTEFLSRPRDSYPYYAEYTGPVTVRKTENKGRGLFATRPIRAGQLVLASKAIDFYIQDSGTVNVGTEYHVEQLIRKVMEHVKDPEVKKSVYALHANAAIPYVHDVGIKKKVNKQRVAAICKSNYFKASRVDKIYGVGLFIEPSYLNHNCIDANCFWLFLGNFLFVRAYKSIQPGEELIISYTKINDTYDARKEMFETREFVCDCRLCTCELNESKEVRLKRMTIVHMLSNELAQKGGLVKPITDLINLDRAIKCLDALRSDQPTLNLPAVELKCHLAVRFLKACELGPAMEILNEVFELVKDSPFQDEICLLLTRIMTVKAAQITTKKNPHNTAKEWAKLLQKHFTMAYGSNKALAIINPEIFALYPALSTGGPLPDHKAK